MHPFDYEGQLRAENDQLRSDLAQYQRHLAEALLLLNRTLDEFKRATEATSRILSGV